MIRLWLMCVLVGCQIGRSQEPDKLVVSVFYESKCPDSKNFIAGQLLPAVNLLQDFLTVHLIPFGKADSIIDNGYQGFECQHGPSECLGNMVQSCTLYHMQGKPDIERVAYVDCEMKTFAGTKGKMQCVRQSHVPVSLIKQCLATAEGMELQLEAERLTKIYNPDFIPTVIIGDNGVFDQEIQDRSQDDLIGTLCSCMEGVRACDEIFNERAMREVLT